jgi:hypothetical protein
MYGPPLSARAPQIAGRVPRAPAPRDCPAPPPHSARLAAGSGPLCAAEGGTAGGGRRAPHPAAEKTMRYAARAPRHVWRRSETGSAVSSSSLSPCDPQTLHHLSMRTHTRGKGRRRTPRRESFLPVLLPQSSRLENRTALSTPSESALRTALKGSRRRLPAAPTLRGAGRPPRSRSPPIRAGPLPQRQGRSRHLGGLRPYAPRDLAPRRRLRGPRLAPPRVRVGPSCTLCRGRGSAGSTAAPAPGLVRPWAHPQPHPVFCVFRRVGFMMGPCVKTQLFPSKNRLPATQSAS